MLYNRRLKFNNFPLDVTMYLTKGTKVAITDKNLLSNDKARVWNKDKCEIIGYLILATEEVSWKDGLIRICIKPSLKS